MPIVAAVCQNVPRGHNRRVSRRSERGTSLPAVLAVALLAIAVSASGCRRKPADPVAATLADLEAAAEARDADAFAGRLSADFAGASGAGRAATVADLKRYFAAYETVAVEVYGVEAERSDGEARVRCVVEFSGQARQLLGLQGLLPPSAVYRFDLTLADESGTWRVRRAAWEPATRPAQ
jgi:hypothetical protein